MAKKIISIFTALFLSLFIYNAYADTVVETDTADLKLVITGIRSTQGSIRIALFNSEKDYRRSGDDGSHAFKTAIAKISEAGTMNVTFKNIPSGTYALKLFQDVDNSGSIKTDWLGRPKEDFGFSNNVDASSGEPDFDQVKFNFDKTHTTQTIKMQKALAS